MTAEQARLSTGALASSLCRFDLQSLPVRAWARSEVGCHCAPQTTAATTIALFKCVVTLETRYQGAARRRAPLFTPRSGTRSLRCAGILYLEDEFGNLGMFTALPVLMSADRRLYTANFSVAAGALNCTPALSPDVRTYNCGLVNETVTAVRKVPPAFRSRASRA
jgi:hypothetical protein